MRIGLNPNKNRNVEIGDYFHHVVIPVYIPNQEGYFKDSLKLLGYCLESLFKTSHAKTYFTIVNNGCCKEVESYIADLHTNQKIHEVIHTDNIGKLNAVLKGITGQNFPLITITDADVLFVNNWQKATYDIFLSFPKAGVVCPSPSSRVVKQYTYNVILNNFWSKKLKFTKVVNKKAMQSFAHSINNPEFYNQYHLDNYLTISENNIKAVIGAGHFVATYKSVIFNRSLQRFTEYSLGGESEEVLLDQPVVNEGYWRLSTEDNFAYHMGNVEEPWMKETLEAIMVDETEFQQPKLGTVKATKWVNYCKENFFNRIIVKPLVWNWFIRYKGLSNEASKNYL
ncbi:glycosyltransferase family 2 protein [Flavobacterium sp.]|uniref:glycosyltransferase family 2 protein n=1 Tax=Flavobacterium sp. TaxID=239 RepID=UPI002B4B7794|nr:glycosyltransferase family 2 protein [Flavobacterium sp.]HLP63687.1 hypothetical protein [Flavobacterium sp.]